MNYLTLFAVIVVGLAATRCPACWKPVLTDAERQKEDAIRNTYSADHFGCSPMERAWQVKQFLIQLRERPHASSCAEHWWLRKLAELKLAGPGRSFIADVGCNKAYFSAAALNYLAAGYGDHLQGFFKVHSTQRLYRRPCGTCGECKQGPSELPTKAQKTVEVLCVEPSEVHSARLSIARNTLYGKPDATTAPGGQQTHVKFYVRNAAVSNYTGMARFPANCAGNTCSLSDTKRAKFRDVVVTTVDHEMDVMQWPYIDVLKIDTEGFDPAVLSGAYRSLLNHRIGAISFEYHRHWNRSGGTLEQCTEYLADLGYSCFYDAQILTKISGACWDKKYEVRRWTNVVCTVRGSAMEKELIRGSYLAEKLQ